MTAVSKTERRDVVPRWRLTASKTADLDTLPAKILDPRLVGGVTRDVDQILAESETAKPLIATDALGVALAEGSEADVTKAAKVVAGFDLASRPMLAALVRRILEADATTSIPTIDSEEGARALVREHKALVRAYPGSPYAWLDLAFIYSGIGQNSKAKSAVDTALALERNHRGVVRAGSRFYIHYGEFDRAMWVLERASAFKTDPWLVSAHIATSRAAGVSAAQMTQGRRLFKDASLRSDQLSELGAALATFEVEHGNLRLAERIVKKSVLAPTENAVAQVGWLESVSDSNFDAASLANCLPNAWEARTFEMYEAAEWRRSCEEAAYWLLDQPFSSRPAIHGSFVAATFLEDYDLALKFAEAGRRANPTDRVVANNFVVGLAKVGRISDARAEFDASFGQGSAEPTLKATEGLLLYREGRFAEGRAAYGFAIQQLLERKDSSRALIASVYQAQEELSIGNAQHGAELLSSLLESSGRDKFNDIVPSLTDRAEHILTRLHEASGLH